jgi:hypothetical protein
MRSHAGLYYCVLALLWIGIVLPLSTANADVVSNLTGNWRLDNAYVNDANSSYTLLRPANGGSLISGGRFSYGYQLDNTTTTTPDFLYYSGDMVSGVITLAGWINPSVLESGTGKTATHPHTIARLYRSGSGNYPDVRLVINNGMLEGSYYNASPAESTTITSTLAIPLNQWTFVALALSSTELSIYKNGEPPQSVPITQALSTRVYNRLLLGVEQNLQTDARGFTGIYDEMRLYNRALSDTDMAELYSYESEPATAGLIGHYHLDANSLANAVPVGFPGLTSVGTTGSGSDGKISEDRLLTNTLASSRNWIYVPFDKGITGDVTFAGWIKPMMLESGAVTATHPHTIVNFYKSSGSNPTLRLAIQEGKLTAIYNNTATGDNFTFNSTLSTPLNVWSFVALKINDNSITVYLNNEPPQSITATGGIAAAINRIMFGLNLNSVSAANGFTGAMDELRVYRRALSDGEISSIYLQEVPVELSFWSVE